MTRPLGSRSTARSSFTISALSLVHMSADPLSGTACGQAEQNGPGKEHDGDVPEEQRPDVARQEYRLQARHKVARRHDGGDRKSTSELQSLMRISYAVFCLRQKKNTTKHIQ